MDNSLLFVYRIQPTRTEMLEEGPTAQEEVIIDQHFDHLQSLTEQGTVLLAGRTLITGLDSFGIIIFRAASADQAQAIVDNDPAVRMGVMRAELYPFRISLAGEIERR